MRKVSLIAASCVAAILLAGWNRREVVHSQAGPTVAEARAVLAELFRETDDSDVRLFFGPVMDSAAKMTEDGIVEFGPCDCNLRTRRFAMAFANDEVFLECSGTFRRSADGTWSATVEGKRQT